MNIGKSCKAMTLFVSIFVGSLLSFPNSSFAEDVWCYSNEYYSFYMKSDTIRARNDLPNGIAYTVAIKPVSNNNNGEVTNVNNLGFAVPNDNLVAYSFARYNGKWEYIGSLKKNPDMRAVWEAMKPYMKKKGIYFNDSWE